MDYLELVGRVIEVNIKDDVDPAMDMAGNVIPMHGGPPTATIKVILDQENRHVDGEVGEKDKPLHERMNDLWARIEQMEINMAAMEERLNEERGTDTDGVWEVHPVAGSGVQSEGQQGRKR